MRKFYSEEIARRVQKLFEEGVSQRQISRDLDIPRTSIQRLLERAAALMQETQETAEIGEIVEEVEPKSSKSKKRMSADEVRQKVATDELTVPFSNWLESGDWVRETAEPVDIYETTEDGEQVLIGQKLDPGIMWPVNYRGARTYDECLIEEMPEQRPVKAGYILSYQQEGTPAVGPAVMTIACLSAARKTVTGKPYVVALGGGTYSKRWYSRRSKKDVTEVAPWPSIIENLVRRKRYSLHPDVQFAAEMNLSPTAANPLTGLQNYIKATSTIFAHPKRAIESVDRHSWSDPISMWTTGAISAPNYILQKAGLKALETHTIGCVIVEVDTEDRLFIRNVDIDPMTGEAWDLDLHIENGYVRLAKSWREDFALPGPVLGLGCIHRKGLNAAHARGVWGLGGAPEDDLPIIDAMEPCAQIFHDLLDGQSINHHEDSDPLAIYARHAQLRASLDEELSQAAEFLVETRRTGTETIIVDSNHNDFVRRWLLKPSTQIEVQNSKLWHLLNWRMREAIDRGEKPEPFQMVMKERAPDALFRFVGPDDHCEIYGTHFNYHGDRGTGGTKGTTVGLTRLGVRIAKAHDHRMTWRDLVKSIGNLLGGAEYATGPTAWTGAWLLVHCNGATQMGNIIGEKWRA